MIENPNDVISVGGGALGGAGLVAWLARSLFGVVVRNLRERDAEIIGQQKEILERLSKLEQQFQFMRGQQAGSAPHA